MLLYCVNLCENKRKMQGTERVGENVCTREKLSPAESSFCRVFLKVHPGADQMKADAVV